MGRGPAMNPMHGKPTTTGFPPNWTVILLESNISMTTTILPLPWIHCILACTPATCRSQSSFFMITIYEIPLHVGLCKPGSDRGPVLQTTMHAGFESGSRRGHETYLSMKHHELRALYHRPVQPKPCTKRLSWQLYAPFMAAYAPFMTTFSILHTTEFFVFFNIARKTILWTFQYLKISSLNGWFKLLVCAIFRIWIS